MKRNILNGDFSLLKSLHRKYRFVKFLGSERDPRMALSYLENRP